MADAADSTCLLSIEGLTITFPYSIQTTGIFDQKWDPMPQRYLSPSLRDQEATSLLVAPLVGVEAEIYNDLWNAVIDRKLKPGTKLEELVIGEIYGISRTVVRKVLVIMEQEGIVSLPQNRGAFIASPSFRDTEELLEANFALILYIIEELAAHPDRISAEHRRKLTDHIKAQEKAEAEQNFHAVRRLHMEFILLLAIIYGNRLLAGTIERVGNRFAVALASYQDTPAPGSRAEFSTKLTRDILEGRPADATDSFRALAEQIRRSLRRDSAEDAVDLRAILASGTRRRPR